MSEQLQLRRGNAAAIAANAGALGEVFVDTDNLRLVLQDGTTNGGFPAAKLSEAITNTRTPTSPTRPIRRPRPTGSSLTRR